MPESFKPQRLSIIAAAIVLLAGPSLGACQESLFERDVLPILTKHCLACHGGLRQKGGLDLRTMPAMLTGGKSGPAVKPRDVESSLMWQRIAADEMPNGEKKLSAAEKNLIKQWIAEGMPTVAEHQKNDDALLAANEQHTPQQVAAAIDQHVQRALTLAKLQPVKRSDDAEFLRRLYIDLTGRVPTAEQAAAFLDSKDPARRAQLIDALLATPQFGEQLGRTWREWICPPELPSEGNAGEQPHTQARNFGKWLGERFSAGDSWDKIVREIVTVEGNIQKKPQIIFFGLVGQDGRVTPDGSARAVASFFLGIQLQCAQCHDDPYRAWAQKEHWSLAAFFSQTNGDFANISESRKQKLPEITIPKSAFKNVGTKVPAAFLGGQSVAASKDQTLRAQLADWLVAKDNPYFARAFANRMWFYLFAQGLVHPVDDIRELNPPSHPGLMKLLANEFAASGFDVKHLFRCLCNSEAYQRTSRVSRGMDEKIITTLTALYGRMPLRVMTADVLYDSLKQAYGDPKLDLRANEAAKGSSIVGMSAPVADAYLEFLRRFGTNKEDATDFTHGIPQMLTLINHPRLLGNSLALSAFRKTMPTPSPEQTIEWLYLSTLSRRPTEEERNEAMRYFKRVDKPAKAYIGILWMLVNRSEFLLVR